MPQNPSFIQSNRQFYGPPNSQKNAPKVTRMPQSKNVSPNAKTTVPKVPTGEDNPVASKLQGNGIQPQVTSPTDDFQNSSGKGISQGQYKGAKLTTRMNNLIGNKK